MADLWGANTREIVVSQGEHKVRPYIGSYFYIWDISRGIHG